MDNVSFLPDAPPVDLFVTLIAHDCGGGACLGGVQPLPHHLGLFINLKLDHWTRTIISVYGIQVIIYHISYIMYNTVDHI